MGIAQGASVNGNLKKIICGDNLAVLRSDAIDTASVDVVYLDPPFNSKSVYNLPFQKLGKDAAAVEAFTDIWHWDDETRHLERELKDGSRSFGLWNYIQHVKIIRGGEDSLSAYLVNMAIRLNELPRVMKTTSALYLHCDPTASHYLKLLLDAIFGAAHFRSEIIWKRTSSHNSARRWGPIHDTILFVSKSDRYKWNRVPTDYNEQYIERFYKYVDESGRRYRLSDLTGGGIRHGESGDPWNGFNPTSYSRHWAVPSAIKEDFPEQAKKLTPHEWLDLFDSHGLIEMTGEGTGWPHVRRYFDQMKGQSIQDIILDIPPLSKRHAERLGYPTQKPIALLERIISASSNEGDVILDPFCGCGTALHAAETCRRNWIGIDISKFSVGVVKNRLAESFEKEILSQITVSGIPTDTDTALALARENPWEFEKWVCGQLGAKGLYKRLGAKGADQGIDGVIEFYADPRQISYAIVQVKGGHVSVNDVKALYTDVETEPLAMAGVFVCFERYKRTAAGAAPSKTFKDKIAGTAWPIIQILTVEEMLAGAMPRLPNQVIQQGFRTRRTHQHQLL